MRWQEISVTVSQQRADAVEALMIQAGAMAVTLIPGNNADPVLEPAAETTPLWTTLIARGLFPAERSIHDLRSAISGELVKSELHSLNIQGLADQPWERAWLEHFKPVRFGNQQNLCICPWHHQPVPVGEVLFMDPGLAFGTGSHATTALCLHYLADTDLQGLSVLDLGCGSGVLALAAALRGAGPVTAVDNDPQACIASRENARRNDLAIRVESTLDGLSGSFDLIVANILSGILIDFAPQLLALTKAGTRLMLSGILEAQADAVIQSYSPAYGPFDIRVDDGWVGLSAVAGQ